MLINTQVLTSLELKSAIVRSPLIVKPDTTVREAIAQMSGVRAICDSTKTVDGQLEELYLEARSSCVLVVEDQQLLGIFTERDVVRLSAQKRSLENLAMQEVMISPVISLQESALTDLFSTINLLQQHHIRHVPILDDQDRVVGIVTNESLRQTSRPVDLLRLRLVSEVMTREVICTAPDTSMLAIAQLMANHRVSSVMVVQTQTSLVEPLQIPVGIITERDIVQFQALGLNLETYLAEAVMSTPVFAVKSDDSLLLVQQIMEQHLIRRLAVTGDQGELLGIVTQTSLLQALNPLELYKMTGVLSQKVAQLEADKIALLENRAVELEQEVAAQTIALRMQAEHEKLMMELATQIRSSLSLQTILDTTVKKVRQLLNCDRVNIWQFDVEGQTLVVAESTNSYLSLLGREINDIYLQQNSTDIFSQDRITVVPDIYTTEMSEYHRQMLIDIYTRSKILVPVFCGDKLWGLLNATESQSAREWKPEEVYLLEYLSIHLAIAIQQATTYQKLEEQLLKQQYTEAILRESEQRYATLTTNSPVGIFHADALGQYTYVNHKYCQITGTTLEMALGDGWQRWLHPEDREFVINQQTQSLQEHSSFYLKYRFQHLDGSIRWVYGQSVAERDAEGQVIGYVGTITDISGQQAALQERQRAEEALQKSEAHQRALISAIPDLMMRINRQGIFLEFLASPNFPIVGNLAAIVGTNVLAALPSDIAHKRMEFIELALQTNSIQVYQQELDLPWGIQVEEVRVVPYSEDEVLVLVRDISAQQAALRERKQSELALQKSEAHQKALMKAIPDLMMRIDHDGMYLEFIASSYKFHVLGAPLIMVGDNLFNTMPPHLAQQRLDAIHLALATNTIQVYEQEFSVDHGIQVEEVRVVPYSEDEVLVLVREISEQRAVLQERQQAELALKQSEAHQRALMSAIPDLMMRIDRQGICLECVATSCNFSIVGYPSEMVGSSVLVTLPLKQAQQRLDYIQLALDTSTIQIYEQEFLIDNRIQTEEVRMVPYSENEVLLLVRDISEQQAALQERKQAEAALIQSEAQSRTILSVMPDYMFQVGGDGIYRAIVTHHRGIDLLKDFNPVGLSMMDLLPPEIADRQLYYIQQAISTGQLQIYEQQLWIDEPTREDGCQRLQDEEVRVIKSGENEALIMIRDISDRKQAEAALVQSEAQNRAILEAIPDFMFRMGADGVYRGFVTKDREINLFNGQIDPTGLSMIDVLPLEIAYRHLYYLEQALSTGELQVYEQQIEINHRLQYEEVRVVKSSEDEALFMIRDITARQAALRELKQAEQKLLQLNQELEIKVLERTQELSQVSSLQQAILNGADYSIISTDLNGVIQTFNAAAARMLGYDAAEVIGKLTPEMIHDRQEVIDRADSLSAELGQEIPPGFESLVAQARQDIVSETEWTYIRKDGSRFPVALSVTALKDNQQQIIGFLGIAQDISDRKRAEAELQKLSDRLAISLKSGAIGCWEWNITQNIILWDERMYELYGVTKANNDFLVYDIWAKGLHPEDRLPTETLLHQATLGQAEYDTEFRVVHPDGSIRFLKAYGVLVRDGQGDAHSMIGINFDITDRKQAEQENQHLRERLQFVMATSPAVIFTCRAEGDYGATFISENIHEVTGYTAAEFLAEPSFWVDHIHPDDVAQVIAELTPLFERGYHSHEYRFQDRDGYYLWLRDELRLVRNEQGSPKEIVGYFADITDRKETELKLRQQAKQERLLGAITQQMRSSLNLQDILKATISELHQVLASDRVFIYRLFLDGTGAAIAEAVSPEFISVLNVTFPEEIFLADRDDYYSKGKVSILADREDPNQLRSPTVVEFLTKIQVKARLVVPIIQNQTIQDQTLWGLLIAHQCDCPRTWQEGEINLLKQVANQLAIAIQQANLFDQLQQQLTERQQAETRLTETNQQLAISNDELARATRLKDEFLANMSHELRTPLNAILGMTEGLEDEVFGSVNQQQIKALKTIERSGSHLLELINDILDVAKIESGQVELECTAVEVASLCQASMVFIKQQALKKGIQFETKLPQHLPDLLVDERRVRQVLINLLNNAVKFTPEGGRISLEVTHLPRSIDLADVSSPNFLKIAVIDTGLGISPENIQKLFQPFMQIDSALNRQYNGTGLGLALVKRIVELHGGRVGLTSELGVGSCFSIELPCIYDPSQPIIINSNGLVTTTTSETSSVVNQSPLILLADNNEANINTFSGYLGAKGYRIMVAKSGQEAIDLAKANQPELILIDMQMPGMDGLEAIEQIRLDPNLVTNPIIGLTALAITIDSTKCLETGAIVYLTKPVKLKHLTTTIQQLLGREGGIL